MIPETLGFKIYESATWRKAVLFGIVATVFSYISAILWYVYFPVFEVGFFSIILLSLLPAVVAYLVSRYIFGARESFKIAVIVFISEIVTFVVLDNLTIFREAQSLLNYG